MVTASKNELSNVPFRVLREDSASSSDDSSLQTNHALSPRPQLSTQSTFPAGNQVFRTFSVPSSKKLIPTNA